MWSQAMRSKYRPSRCNHTSLHSHNAFLCLAWGFSLKMRCLTYCLLFMNHRPFKCAVSSPLCVLNQTSSPFPFRDDRKCVCCSQAISNLASKKLCHEHQQTESLEIHFEFAWYSFFLIHFELKRQISSYTPLVPLKTIPDFETKMGKVCTC